MEGRYGENPDPQVEAYQRALAEKLYWQRRAEEFLNQEIILFPRKRATPTRIYRKFLAELRGYQKRGISLDSTIKAELLASCFSRKFGERGRTPVSGMPDSKIDRIFEGVIAYSEKRVNE